MDSLGAGRKVAAFFCVSLKQAGTARIWPRCTLMRQELPRVVGRVLRDRLEDTTREQLPSSWLILLSRLDKKHELQGQTRKNLQMSGDARDAESD